MNVTRLARACALAATLGTTACSGGGGSSNSGKTSLSVSLMDAPVDGVTEVHVKIDKIWLKPTDGQAMELTLTNGPVTLDLLPLTDQDPALLIDSAEVPPGSYDWLRMDVSASFDGIYDSYVVTDIGGQEEVRVPSGTVRLVDGFDIGPNQAAKLLFDWDLRKGLVDPPGQPGYLLKPAFRMLNVQELGVLTGTVAADTIMGTGDPNHCLADNMDDPLVGNVVYVFAGNVTPDDVDGIDPDPVATADVKQNDAGDFVYRTVIAPGDYTIAFTCQAKNDDPEVDESMTTPIEFVSPVLQTITADAEAVVNF
jgi:Domain of unknown function (DUF4382)